MATALPAWPGPWTDEITGIVQGNAALGPANSLIKKLTPEQRETVTKRGKELVTSLLDPDVRAVKARGILVRLHLELVTPAAQNATVQKLMENPGYRPPSFLNVATYNTVLELVVAKALWDTGHTEFLPWPFDSTALKPDFMLSGHHPDPAGHTDQTFYDACQVVADTVKVGSWKTAPELVTGLVSGVTDKVGTYQGKSVGVVLEAVDNPCLFKDGEPIANDEDIIDTFQERIEALDSAVRRRLRFVHVITPGCAVVTMDADAWSQNLG
ncbi:hypothetical protein [Streptomyces sp. NRRL B-3648]|uniref:hypothetical protein n=1 Tax=Streptomyces sp. NRRL B-3648 TaxID=1519493 RepID=UPI0006AE20A2|nr:hypothetical protein [Streptomyces sp. NRRL B-3648]KOX11456.1 hypothetical protein ADL04_00580 [Streptomyces sp. NRRL B-3648]